MTDIINLIKGTTKMAGVIGWPVRHTLSPPMQNAAIAKLRIDWIYGVFEVEPERLAEALAGARALGMAGLNVTIPHKPGAFALADELDPLAKAIGAVNTVQFKDGRMIGYNTDAVGFTRTVEEEGAFRFKGAVMLLIGAGGAGRALAAGAALNGAAKVTIHEALRPEAAVELAATMGKHFPATRFEVAAAEQLPAVCAEIGEKRGLIANATPLGMKEGDALPIAEGLIPASATAFDCVYIPAKTGFMQAAARRGAKAVGGLGMLARQGAQSLRIWTGLEPDEQLMIGVLRKKLGLEA